MKTNEMTIKKQTHGSSSTTQKVYSSPNPETTIAPRGAKKPRNRGPQAIKPEDRKILSKSIAGCRDRALWLFLTQSRLPAGHISRMNRDTIETVIDTLGDGSQVIMGIGKVQSSDGFYRSFRVGSDCLDAITEYETKERAHDDEPALFVTKQGTRATVSSINADLAGWCKDAGIPPFGSDRFRYTSALEIDTELSCPEAMKLLGNSNPKSPMDCVTEGSDHPSPGLFRRLLRRLLGYFTKS